MINNFLNGPNNSRFFSKIQQLNTDSSAQKEGNIPDDKSLFTLSTATLYLS